MPEPVSRIQVNGVELHYIEHGDGLPVVMVHGSLADYSYWEWSEQVQRVSGDYPVIAYSRRYNHPNRNPPEGNHSAVVEARDLAGLIEALATGPVHLVGHSYGAYTALLFALDHPGAVRSLVLAEPPLIRWLPDIPGGEGILEGFLADSWAPMGRAFREQGRAAGLEASAQWYFGSPLEEVQKEWRELTVRNVAEWQALTTSDDAFPMVEYQRVRRLEVPVLVLSGSRNELGFTALVDERLMELLPDARRVLIPEAGHEMFLDDPEASARAMLEFFHAH